MSCKTFIVVVTAFAFAICFFALSSVYSYAGSTVANGYCGASKNGKNLKWILDDQGVLTVSGKGEMMDFYIADYDAAWNNYKDDIKKVVIKKGVTTIGADAFMDCKNLTDVSFSNTVYELDSCSFYNCRSLTSIDLPEKIVKVVQEALAYTGIKKIHIPYNCDDFNPGAMPELKSITVSPKNERYFVRDNVLFAYYDGPYGNDDRVDKNWCFLAYYPVTKKDKEYVVPDFVDMIGERAFIYEYYASIDEDDVLHDEYIYYNPYLESIILGDDVSFEKDIFGYRLEGDVKCKIIVSKKNINYSNKGDCLCTKDGKTLLSMPISKDTETVTIPDGITHIGEFSCNECTYSEISLPDSVKYIDDNAFENCRDLVKIHLSKNIKSIGSYAFDQCINLKEIELPDSVRSIGDGAFEQCHSLKSIVIPPKVEYMDRFSFGLCYGLESITIPASVTKIDEDTLFGTYAQFFTYSGSYAESYFGKDSVTIIPHDEHTVVTDKKESPTCTEVGYTEGSHCSVCGKVIKAQKKIAKVDHKWNKKYSVIEFPTFLDCGYKAKKCSICGAIKKKSEKKIAKLKVNRTKFTKVKSAKRAIAISWKKTKNVTGYQIQYSTFDYFYGKKTINIKTASDVSTVIKNLKSKKKYYLRIRAYKKVGNVKCYSKWSSIKSIVTK